MTHTHKFLSNYIPFNANVIVGDGRTIKAISKENITLQSSISGNPIHLTFADVLYVPHISKNLISSSAAAQQEIDTYISTPTCTLYKAKQLVCISTISHGLYYLQCDTISASISANISQGNVNQQSNQTAVLPHPASISGPPHEGTWLHPSSRTSYENPK
eukprot:TRINITY_DN16918_c0_g1_i1.p2 TRINITY_DN16918_c0_g1~~TRINITY_DN16918_c0_g1_i1.p2  ORF type:complete len:160 (-),score=17.28 TRINITY_DN16918_c0_g1_i1:366-845(-)